MDNRIFPISISLFKPRDILILEYKDLAPTYNMFKNGYSWEDFRIFLKSKSPFKVLEDLKKIAPNMDIALLCYEGNPDNCHRHIVAEWFKSELGIDVTEYESPMKQPCLSIQQPWAELIVSGLKNIENRDWNTRFRGEFYVHTGKRFDKESFLEMKRRGYLEHFQSEKDFLLGGIVGKATIVDVIQKSDSPWFIGKYGFLLKNMHKIPFIPMAGKLNFFEFDTTNQYAEKKATEKAKMEPKKDPSLF